MNAAKPSSGASSSTFNGIAREWAIEAKKQVAALERSEFAEYDALHEISAEPK
jgi:hypothetical protein